MSNLPNAYHITVEGHVQGVGFRFFCLRAARQQHLCGWVRNLASGEVEIHAEGSTGNLSQFIHMLKKGPGSVAQILSEATASEQYADFRVRF